MNDKKKSICQAMAKINQLSHKEFSTTQIGEYADTILEIFPDTTAKDIQLIMTLFFKEIEDFNPHKGVRNFTGYLSRKKIEQDRKKLSTYGPFEY